MADNIKNVERRKLQREKEESVALQAIKQGEISARELVVPLERDRKEIGGAYHEIPGLRHETRDVLKQLNSNIQLLEDLGGRLGFVLAEVRGLIRK